MSEINVGRPLFGLAAAGQHRPTSNVGETARAPLETKRHR